MGKTKHRKSGNSRKQMPKARVKKVIGTFQSLSELRFLDHEKNVERVVKGVEAGTMSPLDRHEYAQATDRPRYSPNVRRIQKLLMPNATF